MTSPSTRTLCSPAVTLDTTFAELYAGGDAALGRAQPVLLPILPSTEVDLSPSFPRAKKYTYHDTPMHADTPAKEIEEHRDIAAARNLSLLPTRMAFISGTMPIYIFHHPSTTGGNLSQIERVLGSLPAHQRPTLRPVNGPKDVIVSPRETLAVTFPLDGLERLSHLVEPAVHYELLSKRGLALSGLQTPRATLLDLDVSRSQWDFHIRPSMIAVTDSARPIGEMEQRSLLVCVDSSAPAGSEDLVSYIRHHELPFVIKLQQSLAGAGTWLINNASERESAAQDIPRIIKHFIAKVEPEAATLKPCTLIFTEMVTEVVDAWALGFFVQRGGNPVFLGCTYQRIEDGHWTGSSIDYRNQPALSKRLDGSMRSIAHFLWSRGYYGPVGADILEDPAGTQWVVDLNVRTPSSLILTLLRGHFHVERGLGIARLMPDLRPRISRDELELALQPEIAEGAVIIVAWVENDLGKTGSFASIIVAAQETEALDRLSTRVEAACSGQM